MEFWFKKLISVFLLPVPVMTLLLILGLILLSIIRAKKLGALLVSLACIILLVFSNSTISNAMIDVLQNHYPPLIQPPNNVQAIVVLGSGTTGKKGYPPNLTLDSASLSRLIESVRLLKLVEQNNPNAQLILSGGRVFESPIISGKMRNTALMLGVGENKMLLESGSRDTHEEAVFLKKTLQNKSFILVTSAYHMPRAMALFEHQGLHPIAAPTQFFNAQSDYFSWIPSANSLVKSNIAIHEYFGSWWAHCRGYTTR